MLGLGTLHSKTLLNGNIDTIGFKDLIYTAYNNDIRFFDTGFFYSNGQILKYLGDILKEFDHKSFMVSAKYIINNQYTFDEIFDSQFKDLNMQYIDLYMLHDVNDFNFKSYVEYIDKLDVLKQKNLIKYTGFSSHMSSENLKYFLDLYDWDYVYIYLNWLDYFCNDGELIYNICKNKNIKIVFMGPLKGGKLIDWFSKYFYDKNQLIQLSIQFLKSLGNDNIILCGAEDSNELRNYIYALEDKLDEDKLNTFKNLSVQYKTKKLIPCTDCKYCRNLCNNNVDISNIIKVVNKYLYEDEHNLKWLYRWLYEGGYIDDINKCISCKQCESICPQNIKISKIIQDLRHEFSAN